MGNEYKGVSRNMERIFWQITEPRRTKEINYKRNKEINKVEVEELAVEDVKKAIRNLKNNKVIFMWDIPVCGEYKLVQIIVNHTQ